ncbi:Golgi transport complex subunit 4, partial [Cichlidogyrus casuarinus]
MNANNAFFTNINQLPDALKQLDAAEDALMEELASVVSSKAKISSDFKTSLENRPKYSDVRVPSGKVQKLLEHASNLSLGISNKVRKLDGAKQKVHNTIGVIEKLFIFRECADKLRPAVVSNNFEISTVLIRKYLSLSNELIDEVIRIEGSNVKSFDDHSAVIVKILETFAQVIKEYEPKIKDFYTPVQFARIILNLQTECDLLCSRSISALLRFINIDSILNTCKTSIFNTNPESNQNGALKETSNSEISQLIVIFSQLNVRCSLYLRFLMRRIHSDPEIKSALLNSKVAKLSANLMDYYITLEHCQIAELISRALKVEEIDPELK